MNNWLEYCAINDLPKKYQEARCTMQPLEIIREGMEWVKNPKSMIVTGSPGTGKTYFSYCLAKGIVNKDGVLNTLIHKSKSLDEALLKEYTEHGSSWFFIQSLIQIKYLFIDDFGLERATDRLTRDVYEIIDSRWEHQRVTVLTTNLDAEQIGGFYGSRVLSRLKDYRWLKFDGPDLRGQEIAI